jgi:hypothetical protein
MSSKLLSILATKERGRGKDRLGPVKLYIRLSLFGLGLFGLGVFASWRLGVKTASLIGLAQSNRAWPSPRRVREPSDRPVALEPAQKPYSLSILRGPFL